MLELKFNNIGESKKINASYNFGFNLYNYADLKEVKNTNASSVQLQETLIEVKY